MLDKLLTYYRAQQLSVEETFHKFLLMGKTVYVFKHPSGSLKMLSCPAFHLSSYPHCLFGLSGKAGADEIASLQQEIEATESAFSELESLPPLSQEDLYTSLLALSLVHENTAHLYGLPLELLQASQLLNRIFESADGALCFPVRKENHLLNLITYHPDKGTTYLNANIGAVWHSKITYDNKTAVFHTEVASLIPALNVFSLSQHTHLLCHPNVPDQVLDRIVETLTIKNFRDLQVFLEDPNACLLALRLVTHKINWTDEYTESFQVLCAAPGKWSLWVHTTSKEPVLVFGKLFSEMNEAFRSLTDTKEPFTDFFKIRIQNCGQSKSSRLFTFNLHPELIFLITQLLIRTYKLPFQLHLSCHQE